MSSTTYQKSLEIPVGEVAKNGFYYNPISPLKHNMKTRLDEMSAFRASCVLHNDIN